MSEPQLLQAALDVLIGEREQLIEAGRNATKLLRRASKHSRVQVRRIRRRESFLSLVHHHLRGAAAGGGRGLGY